MKGMRPPIHQILSFGFGPKGLLKTIDIQRIKGFFALPTAVILLYIDHRILPGPRLCGKTAACRRRSCYTAYL